ncbi:MAG: hypothetical protein KGM91_28300, partial [Burkholderiales bacterium]|nr:hypothetical protein [Burkholderiales bacterium]
VRLTLARRGPAVAGSEAALRETAQVLADALDLARPDPAPGDEFDPTVVLLPMEAPAEDFKPWLLRRLQLLRRDARRIRAAAQRTLDSAAAR